MMRRQSQSRSRSGHRLNSVCVTPNPPFLSQTARRLSHAPVSTHNCKENLIGSDHEQTVHELQIQILEMKSALFESKFKVESLKKKLKKQTDTNKDLLSRIEELQSGTCQLKSDNTIMMQQRLGELDARLTAFKV